jgi:hypothetical protein
MIAIPVATVVAAGIGAGAFAVGLSAARDVPEAVTDDTTFDVFVDGDQEYSTGGVAGVGDPDGFGTFEITIDTATDQVCVDGDIANVDDLTMLHIHRGQAGINGPIVVDFAHAGSPQVQKCVPGGSVTDEIAANPLSFYLNAHTNTPVTGVFPNGAVRGQLQPGGSLTTLLPTPVRVYDSRVPNSLGNPALLSGSTTAVDLSPTTAGAPGSLPPNATAALISVTVTDVRAAGFLSVYSGALAAPPATSTLNWSGHDQAVTTTVKVDASGSVKVTIGPDGAADVIIDVLGYLTSTPVLVTM